MRISDWSSDVCSSDLEKGGLGRLRVVPIAVEIADGPDAHLARLALRQRLAGLVENRQIDQRLRRRPGRHRLFQIIFVDDAATDGVGFGHAIDRKSTRLNSSYLCATCMPSSA